MNAIPLCPKISESLSIQPFQNGSATVFVKQTKKSYVIGGKEYRLLLCMDGRSDFSALSRTSGCYTPEQVEHLTGIFQKLGLLHDGEGQKRRLYLARSGRLKYKLGLFDGNRAFSADSPAVRLFAGLLLYAAPLLFLAGLARLWFSLPHYPAFRAADLLDLPLFLYAALFFLITTLHELGHAVVARSLRVQVPEIGVMLYAILPLAYTDMSFSRLLPRRADRMKCLFAGICTNLLLAGLSLLCCWPGISAAAFRFLCANALINGLLVLANLVVFFKLDGYFILQDLLEIPYLYENSLRFLSSRLAGAVSRLRAKRQSGRKLQISRLRAGVRARRLTKNDLPPLLYGSFGLLCTLYLPFLIVSLATAIL